MKEEIDFQLGICLPAALSGGAYTAGVMDYLVEALDEWEKKKKTHSPEEVPQHFVNLSLIGGSSEMGLTALIHALAIKKEFEPVSSIPNQSNILACIPTNPFYNTWVDFMEESYQGPAIPIFLEILKAKDLSKANGSLSLDSDFLEKEVNQKLETAIKQNSIRTYAPPSFDSFTYPSYFHRLIAISNHQEEIFGKTPPLDQIDEINFIFSKSEVKKRGWNQMAPLFLETILRYKLAALAKKDFENFAKGDNQNPSTRQLMDLLWLIHISGRSIAKSEFDLTEEGDAELLNLKIFEKVRSKLNSKWGLNLLKENESAISQKTKVVMVNPYFGKSGKKSLGNDYLDSSKSGNYVISPVRYTFNSMGEREVEGNNAIACSSLDGLGGFVCKQFRIHDFFLGRANCEKFLRDHFTISPEYDKSIQDKGYGKMDDKNKSDFVSKVDGRLQLIPIFSPRKESPYMPDFGEGMVWPKINIRELESYREDIHEGVDALKSNFFELKPKNQVIQWAMRKMQINRVITEKIMESSKISLQEHNQLIS
ncbi:hypothetical protein JYB62_01830 [Algoriphagus lutimaris]|uniref:hypothetical protein n=1 Tax=Algoriphagus lutimaris TaxID=613197 RepID=UPI00196B0041|nr:hypothetical protein [Algoriphagus lutimaris]MBN3518727.1 hypothetical protein [Algoriphagus lutimaris]